jgi:TolA-binding protein
MLNWRFMMRFRRGSQMALAFGCIFALALLLGDTSAQQRRRRRLSRRVTNPVATTPARTSSSSAPLDSPDTPQIISTDDGSTSGSGATSSSGIAGRPRNGVASSPSSETDPDSTRRTVNKLSADVTRLSEKLSQMEEQQRTLVDLERLSRAEQRTENLRAQLREVTAKEADLQARSEQLDIDLQPENIERSLASYGSLHPEEVRAQRRRLLESEKARVSAQSTQLAASRARLETAIATADAEVDRLRQRIDATPAAAQVNSNSNTQSTPATSTASPSTPDVTVSVPSAQPSPVPR